jgi:hypothetical protein
MKKIVLAALSAVTGSCAALAGGDLRVGIIGCDTSHATAFAKLANVDKNPAAAGMRVTAAYKWGSRDILSSTNRYPMFLAQLKEYGVEMKDSIPELLKDVDCVLLETNDGRPHYAQALEVFKSGKPCFIDKPAAHDLADVWRLVEAGRKLNAKWFCSSSLRFADNIADARAGKLGKLRGASTRSPCGIEPTHSRYYWYAIHGTEPLFAILGTGCKEVRCIAGASEDVLVGTWNDGRLGVQYALDRKVMDGAGYGGAILSEKGATPVGDNPGYAPLVEAIVKFFRTGVAPVTLDETLEIYAFMSAAEKSRSKGGAVVTIAEILDEAKREAARRGNN